MQLAVSRLIALVCLAAVSSSVLADQGGARKLYRYTNDKGVVVLDFHVPPEYAYKGYTVLTPKGMVLEVVPPTMSPAERERYRQQEPERLKAQEEQRKRDEDDRRLLSVYSTAYDAARARDRKLEALDLQISVDKGNQARLQAVLDDTQARAANRERAGQAVPEDVVAEIDSLNRQIETLSKGIAKREQEKEQIREAARVDMERLDYLHAHPELIRKLEESAPKGLPPAPR